MQYHRRRRRRRQAHPCRRRRHGRPDWRAIEPVSARARSRPRSSAPTACRSSWAASMSPAASRCCRSCRADLQEALDLGIHLFAGEAEGRMAEVLRDIAGGNAKPIYNYLNDMPEMAAAVYPILPRACGDAGRRPLFELRCRPRLPVPVQLLHHHQRAGAQIALPHAGRRRGDRARQRGAGRHALLRHRRQFRAQPQLGADPRPPDRAARDGQVQDPAPAPGRHAVPPHPGLHREGGARRLQRRLHRA